MNVFSIISVFCLMSVLLSYVGVRIMAEWKRYGLVQSRDRGGYRMIFKKII